MTLMESLMTQSDSDAKWRVQRRAATPGHLKLHPSIFSDRRHAYLRRYLTMSCIGRILS